MKCHKPLTRFVIFLPLLQIQAAVDIETQDFFINFLQALANGSPTRWYSLVTFVDDQTPNSLANEWIFQVNVPKFVFALTSLGTYNSPKNVNAYVIVASPEIWQETQLTLVKALKDKRLDANKPFFVFTDSMELNLDIREHLDVTIIRKIWHWDFQKRTFQLNSLMFKRNRLLSKIKSEEMIGFYYGTKNFDENGKRILFDRSFSYQNRRVKVSAFIIPPTTIECAADSSKICGRDPNLVSTLGKMLNFTPEFVPPPAKSKWGDKLSNGTWTGIIGDVSRGVTTLGVANIFTTLHYIEQVDISYPYDFSCSTFLTPARQPLPQWFTLIKPFSLSLWMATIFSLFLGGVLIQLSSLLYQWLFNSNLRDRLIHFGEAMMYNAQSITGVRSGSDDFPAWPLRIYNSNWWLFCFLIGTVYRTGLTSWVASSPIFMLPVDTIAQLVKSELIPYGYNTFIRDIAQYSTDPWTVELGKRQRLVPVNISVQALMGEDYSKALYENKNYLEYLAATVLPPSLAQITNSTRVLMDPRQRFHVMRECFRTFPVAVAVTPGSVFKDAITFTIHRLNGAGLLDFWLDSVIHRDTSASSGLSSSNDHVYAPFSLYHLEGVFYLFLVCCLVVVVCFLGELIVYQFQNHSFY